MSASYQAVLWNRQKRIYDLLMAALMALYLLVFVLSNVFIHPEITPQTLIIRASGTLAILMLHIILMIGPLARISPLFLPLLYNRRHLGVSMFLMAAVHGIFSIIQFHTLGNKNAFVSIFLSNPEYTSFPNFPFQTLGFFALLILFLMAATSHDFWLKNLSPRIWKSLHMMVYVAYGLVLMHVMLGVVQLENSPLIIGLIGLGLFFLVGLHLWAGIRQYFKDRPLKSHLYEKGFYPVCKLEEILPNRAKVTILKGENIAIFRKGDKLSALSNVCKHQNGPLGEGKIVNGCVVCPWHGYEYQPEDGCSPPPFKEKVSTYRVRVEGGNVFVNPAPFPEGTYVEPAHI